jgi:glycosyltransferase involved in cell wall biosynthesis
VQLLRDCLDSILQLSLRPEEREIILVDDGSPMSPMLQLADYVNDIIYVRKPNGGVSAARNLGMRMATGRYIQFVDGDDMLLHDAYEHVLGIVRASQVDVVMFDFTSTLDAQTAYSDESLTSGRELMRNSNIRGTACCYLSRRFVLGELQFTPGIAYGEDEEFTPQLLLRADSVIRTSATAYYYRPRSSSAIHDLSIRKRLQRLNDAKTVISRLYLLADTMPAPERIALLRRVHQLTMDYIYNVILLTQNRHYLNRRLDELRSMNLFPLPDRNYTKKYTWFRRLSNTELGLSMLMRAIPYLSRA